MQIKNCTLQTLLCCPRFLHRINNYIHCHHMPRASFFSARCLSLALDPRCSHGQIKFIKRAKNKTKQQKPKTAFVKYWSCYLTDVSKMHIVFKKTLLWIHCRAVPGSREVDVQNVEALFTQWPTFTQSKVKLHWLHCDFDTFSPPEASQNC